jgi:nitrite reductase/ring-hydroxylating ferredoxin subunit
MESRRYFLKKTCSLCLAIAGTGAAISALTSCSSIPLIKVNPHDGKLLVPIESFGSKPYVLVRSLKLDFDLLLVNKSEKFHAILLQCSHEMQPLTVSGNFINCASHGSTFDLFGNVLKAPATKNLTIYPASKENNSIIITLN